MIITSKISRRNLSTRFFGHLFGLTLFPNWFRFPVHKINIENPFKTTSSIRSMGNSKMGIIQTEIHSNAISFHNKSCQINMKCWIYGRRITIITSCELWANKQFFDPKMATRKKIGNIYQCRLMLMTSNQVEFSHCNWLMWKCQMWYQTSIYNG